MSDKKKIEDCKDDCDCCFCEWQRKNRRASTETEKAIVKAITQALNQNVSGKVPIHE